MRFTGPGGEVRGRIEGGEWKASPSSGEGRGIGLSFGLSFPDELSRRDVTLRGTVRCEGTLYSTEGLRELDAEYYAARDAKWEAGKAAGEALERAEAPRRWNPESERWERRYEEEGAASKLWKRARYLLAERREKSVTDRRPMPKELSMDCGPFPGIEGEAYARRGGRIVLEGRGWGGGEGGRNVVDGAHQRQAGVLQGHLRVGEGGGGGGRGGACILQGRMMIIIVCLQFREC